MSMRASAFLRNSLKSSASFDWATVSGVSVLLATSLCISPALANPLGANVTTGSASLSVSSPSRTTIDQTSEDVVIDWSSFNIGANQTTQFVQPNAQAIAVNRIGGASASKIMGTLDANGRIVLINGNGMLFGKGSQVDVGSLVATSSGGSDSDLLAGKFTSAGSQTAAIVNRGTIDAASRGTVALVAPNVTNQGIVEAKLGTVALGAAEEFTIDFKGDGLVSFAARGEGPARIVDSGSIDAANVSLTARAAEGIATGVVNVSGTIVAQSAHDRGGVITLDAGDGGDIMTEHAKLDASGRTGGGSIEIGGWNENSVVIGRGSVLSASATGAGNGGTISVIASAADIKGHVNAEGGKLSGNGGTVETSGGVVETLGAKVDTLASHGSKGTWSLDPENVTISTATTKGGTLTNGVFDPTSDNSNLNVTTLEDALASSNVEVTTGKNGHQGGNINVVSALAWDTSSTLFLDANKGIRVWAPITVESNGYLVLQYNDGSTLGTLSFGGINPLRGHIAFTDVVDGVAQGALRINGEGYALVTSTAQLASDISNNVSDDYALADSFNASADGVYTSSPIPTADFGVFDGLGNTISHLTIHDSTKNPGAVGLFGSANAAIENLGLEDVSVTAKGGTYSVVGGLVGGADGTLSNDLVTGRVSLVTGSASVSDSNSVGLMAGLSYGDILDSLTRGAATGGTGAIVGGLVGYDYNAIISSFSTANVDGGNFSRIGGLAGAGTIVDSYATGNITGEASSYAGGLVGNGSATNSYATGNVTGGTGSSAGGLIGTGDTTNSYSTGNVTAGTNSYAGGLIGNGSATSSHATGNVTGGASSYAGGLVGSGDSNGSYATGNVIAGSNSYVGGLIGSGSAGNSFASGTVTGGTSSDVGGLVGLNSNSTNSYATGSVTGGTDSNVGGLVGLNTGNISYSYSTGAVSGGTGSTIGGLIGDDQSAPGSVFATYWDTDTSGVASLTQGAGNIASDYGISGLTTAQLQSGLPFGFSAAIWGESSKINNGLPYLLALPPV